MPATSGTLSQCLPDGRIAITHSGVQKGFLTVADVIVVDGDGRPDGPAVRPSAETLLHCEAYALYPDAGALLYGHSLAATVPSMAATGRGMRFAGYEAPKVFAGQRTHDGVLELPLVENDQDMARLARTVEPMLDVLSPI